MVVRGWGLGVGCVFIGSSVGGVAGCGRGRLAGLGGEDIVLDERGAQELIAD